MTHRNASQQCGSAVLVLLAILGLATLLFVAIGSWAIRGQNERNQNTEESLARAKEALIAYAVSTDPAAARIGDLPCPYPDEDGPQPPSCGNAAGTTGQSTRLGRLPWRELGQDRLTDSSGETLWYAVSNNFKRNTSAGAINSATLGTITIRDSSNSIQFDATANSGVAAVIIAPGPPLGDQRRGTVAERNDPHNYLEAAAGEDNADFADNSLNGFIAGPVRDSSGNVLSNDRILVVTRDELIAAVERRVAREALACLANYPGTIPWPAPLSVPISYAGTPGTYFGRFPMSTANLNQSRSIGEIADRVDVARIALSSIDAMAPETEAARKSAAATLLAVSRELASAVVVLDRLLSLTISQSATATNLLTGTTGSLAVASSSTTAQRRADNSLLAAQNLLRTIEKSGTDLFLPALGAAIDEMQLQLTEDRLPSEAKPTAVANWAAVVTAKALALRALADEANVADDAIRSAAKVLKQSSLSTVATASQPTATGIVTLVSTSAIATANTATALRDTIALQAKPIRSLASGAATYSRALSAFRASGNPLQFGALADAAAALKASINAIPDHTDAIQVAKSSVVAAIDNLIGFGTQVSLADITSGGIVVLNRGNDLLTLVVADANTRGVSVAPYHLSKLIVTLQNRRDDYVTSPSSSKLTTLKQAGSDLSAYIDQRIASTAGTLDGVGSYVVLAKGLNDTLVAAATQAGDAPSAQNISRALIAAGNAVSAARVVDKEVAAVPGTGVDLDWDSEAGGKCRSLGWWGRNGWIDYVLYQITDPSRDVGGNLTVDGHGAHQIVVLVAGRALSSQVRPSASVADYLEGTNFHTSRNAPAISPVPAFTHGAVSATFNDQLGY